MKIAGWKTLAFLLSALALFILAACGGSSNATPSTTGTLSLSLTDATLYQYQAVYVTIDEVSVHVGATMTGGTTGMGPADDGGGEWKIVPTPKQTVNLLELVNGVLLELGLTELEAGHYTQLRLLIGGTPDSGQNVFGNPHPFANYIIDENDVAHSLKVPSGMQSGIKLVRGFDIYAGEITELILDFDAAKSVVKAGNSGKWLLKPTIKVLDTRQYAVINGTVADAVGLLPDALVSAQTTESALDEATQVNSVATTISDDFGEYVLLVNPGAYNLVAFADGYDPACTQVEPTSDADWTEHILLVASSTGATLTGGVSVIDGHDEQPVEISVRQALYCYDETLLVEVLSDQIANGGSYSFNLPDGNYRVVASSIGETTQAVDVSLADGGTVVQDFDLD